MKTAIQAILEIIENAGGTVTHQPKTVVEALELLGDIIEGGGGGASIDLGITGASVGQYAKIASVDSDGKPTSWTADTPAGIMYSLGVTLATADGATVTGQTVTVRDTDSAGTIVATETYNGEPLTFTLPAGFAYYVEATDTLRMYGRPSTASGTMTGATNVTLTYAPLASVLVKDAQTGRYTNASLAEFWERQRDGKVYGRSKPKSSAVQYTKTDDNYGVADPIPGWVGHPAVDPYIAGNFGPYIKYLVNGGCDPDGSPFVTAIKKIDSDFALDGTNGDVFVMAPVRYRKWDQSGNDAVTLQITDTPRAGYVPCEGAPMPDGTLVPYMLYAKYGGVKGADGRMHSYSGYPIWNRNVSHNSLMTQCDTANTGYSGKNTADLQYLQDMFDTKYATEDMQTVFMGCTSYYLNYDVTVAETDTRRVIIATSNANNLVVGSWVTLGTSNNGAQILASTQITSIEEYDASNSAVNLAASADFTTAVGNKLSTEPWGTGRTDLVEGDGAYSQAGLLSGKEPCVIQGIECFYGLTEILGNVIISNDGTSGWVPFVNHDSRNEATSLTSDYTSCGAALPTGSTDDWKYPLYAEEHEGLQYGTTTGGSTTVGMCDGEYVNKLETTGTREWPSGGYLSDGRGAGLRCVGADSGLSVAYWSIGSRLSARGRSHAIEEAEEEPQAAQA